MAEILQMGNSQLALTYIIIFNVLFCWFIAQLLIKVFNYWEMCIPFCNYTSFLLVGTEFALLSDFKYYSVPTCDACCWWHTSQVSTKFSLVVVSWKTLDLSYIVDVLLVSPTSVWVQWLKYYRICKFCSAQPVLPSCPHHCCLKAS